MTDVPRVLSLFGRPLGAPVPVEPSPTPVPTTTATPRRPECVSTVVTYATFMRTPERRSTGGIGWVFRSRWSNAQERVATFRQHACHSTLGELEEHARHYARQGVVEGELEVRSESDGPDRDLAERLARYAATCHPSPQLVTREDVGSFAETAHPRSSP